MAHGVSRNHHDTVIYLYRVSKSSGTAVRGIRGVDGGAPVEAIHCQGLACWISRVSRAEFAEQLAKNMEDLDWLAAASIRHQQVVTAIAETAEILPARLGTVFLDESSLRADIKKRKAALDADFQRIEGSEEWGIKVFATRPDKIQLPARIRKGREYLAAKSALLQSRQRPADGEITRFAKALEQISVAAAAGGRISSGQRGLQFQVSLLLKRARRKKLQALITKFSKDWKGKRRIERTGPWPPYSFVSRHTE